MFCAPPKPLVGSLRKAQSCAAMYQRFIPEWPALIESFERDVKRVEEALKARKAPK